MDRLNFNVLQQFWTIAKSYWSGDEKWLARGLLLGCATNASGAGARERVTLPVIAISPPR